MMNRGGRPAGDGSRWLVLVTGIFGAFMSILDSTIVNTAIPKVQAVFGADLHQASYIATGYTLAAGVVVSSSGFLANRFGIKRIYVLSLAAFTIGSALCGLAWNMPVLIFFRVLQGAGGAALFPLTFSLVFASFPPEQRGLANGLFGIPVLFAPSIGPTLGGYIVEFIDWRWIFYVNVPIGAVAIFMSIRYLREAPIQRDLPFDLRGFLIISSGLALLLYGVSNLAYDGWTSIRTVSGPIVLALGLLALAIPVELSTPRPLLDLRLFKIRNYWAGNLIIWIGTVGLFGAGFLLPQYLQNLRGLGPYPAGRLLLPLGLAAMVGTIVGGILYNRVGPRTLIILGAVITVFNTYKIGAWSTLYSPFAGLIPLLILRGLTLPWMAQNTNTVALQGITGQALNGASTLITVARNVVASLALALLTNDLQTKRLVHQADLTSQFSLHNPATLRLYNQLSAAAVSHGATLAQARLMALADMAQQVAQQASALAFQDVYWIAATVTIPAIFLPILLRPLRQATRGAPAAMAAE